MDDYNYTRYFKYRTPDGVVYCTKKYMPKCLYKSAESYVRELHNNSRVGEDCDIEVFVSDDDINYKRFIVRLHLVVLKTLVATAFNIEEK